MNRLNEELLAPHLPRKANREIHPLLFGNTLADPLRILPETQTMCLKSLGESWSGAHMGKKNTRNGTDFGREHCR